MRQCERRTPKPSGYSQPRLRSASPSTSRRRAGGQVARSGCSEWLAAQRQPSRSKTAACYNRSCAALARAHALRRAKQLDSAFECVRVIYAKIARSHTKHVGASQ